MWPVFQNFWVYVRSGHWVVTPYATCQVIFRQNRQIVTQDNVFYKNIFQYIFKAHSFVFDLYYWGFHAYHLFIYSFFHSFSAFDHSLFLRTGLCSTHESWVKFDSTLTQMSRVDSAVKKNQGFESSQSRSRWWSFESELSQLDAV